MPLARLLLILVLASCSSAHAQSSEQAPQASAPSSAAELTRERTLIEGSEAARNRSDYATARALAAEAVASLLARPDVEQDAEWLVLLNSAGFASWRSQDARTANEAWLRVCDVRSRSLPDEHPDLQRVRSELAKSLYAIGDLQRARALFEKVLEVNSRTLADDHPDLQSARGNLAATLRQLGDFFGARALQEKVLEIHLRTLPDDHPDLQASRNNLANTLAGLGDRQGARVLREKVLEVRSRTLPDDHPDLQGSRLNYAATLKQFGDLRGARALQEKVLDVQTRTLTSDHPDLQVVRGNLAATYSDLGDLPRARSLFEKVLEVDSRTLPDDHPHLQAARNNLANAIRQLGDLQGARAMFVKVLEVRSRTLPNDHPDLQISRGNLAVTLYALGDLVGARSLQEKELEVSSQRLPDDHPDLQFARGNLAVTLHQLGDFQGAKALYEKVLEVQARALPDDHPDLQRSRLNLAILLESLGQPDDAKAVFEELLAVQSRTLPDDHPDLQVTRMCLAGMIKETGDFQRARALFQRVLDVNSRTMPNDHPDLQRVRFHLASTIARQAARTSRTMGGEGTSARTPDREREECDELIRALCRAQVHAARDAICGSPSREAEERCASVGMSPGISLSFALGYGVFDPLRALESQSFAVAEATRGTALVSAEFTRIAASSPKYSELRDALRDASDALAGLAQKGTASEEFDRARTHREWIEREIVALARELSGGKDSAVEFGVAELAARLGGRGVAVAFRRFSKTRVDAVDELDSTGQSRVRETSVDSLCAFVVRTSNGRAPVESAPTSTLTLLDLGPIEPIEAAVRAWRDGLGVGRDGRGVAPGAPAESALGVDARGAALREKIFDPLLPALAGEQRIVVALDDVLHLVPLDALPFDERSLIGDRWRIETRATLSELLQPSEPSNWTGTLVAFGDVEYGARPLSDDAGNARDASAMPVGPRAADHAGILRGTAWSEGFAELPGTGVEVRGVARCFLDQFGAGALAELCENASATRERLLTLASQARWLHIATHGWFAPESIRSWSDPEPLDKKSGLALRLSAEEQVKGMRPMLLCGLALAGANLPETATGRVPGLVTADELSTLDLTNCELVVLSACDTNVGINRAGQGVASLQKALQMAGARSVITSLWKVPDVATKELMLDFYRRLWVEKKPKWQALWEAKRKLRDATDDSGRPKYSTRDWAAWVLTGEPV